MRDRRILSGYLSCPHFSPAYETLAVVEVLCFDANNLFSIDVSQSLHETSYSTKDYFCMFWLRYEAIHGEYVCRGYM